MFTAEGGNIEVPVVELGGGFGSIVEDEPEQDKNQDI